MDMDVSMHEPYCTVYEVLRKLCKLTIFGDQSGFNLSHARLKLFLKSIYSYARLSLTLMRVARREGTQLAMIESTMTIPSQIQTLCVAG